VQREVPYGTWFVVLDVLNLVWWWSDLKVFVQCLCLFPLWRITSDSHSNCPLLFGVGWVSVKNVVFSKL
jgi:hypothetical protein